MSCYLILVWFNFHLSAHPDSKVSELLSEYKKDSAFKGNSHTSTSEENVVELVCCYTDQKSVLTVDRKSVV